jgi:hypothetical protein
VHLTVMTTAKALAKNVVNNLAGPLAYVLFALGADNVSVDWERDSVGKLVHDALLLNGKLSLREDQQLRVAVAKPVSAVGSEQGTQVNTIILREIGL